MLITRKYVIGNLIPISTFLQPFNGHVRNDSLEVATIYKAYFSGLQSISGNIPAKVLGTFTYLHFRILKFPLNHMNHMNLPMNYALPIKSTLLLAEILQCGAPSVISCFINPNLTIVISIINHSDMGVIWPNLAIVWGPHIVGNHHKSTTFPAEFPMFHAQHTSPRSHALATKKCSESIPGTVPTSAKKKTNQGGTTVHPQF